jgi:hypothetical protein
MSKSFSIFYISLLLSCSVSAQLSATQRTKLITQYNELLAKAETIGNKADSVNFIWYAQLLEPYIHIEFFPVFYKEADPEFFTDKNMEARNQWIASSQDKLKQLRLRKDIDIYVEKADSLHVYNHEQLTSLPQFKPYRRKIKLKWHEEFLPSVELIKSATADTIYKNTVNYLRKLKVVEQQYQNKYTRGYRDRNLLSFFVDGYLERLKRKTMNTRFEEKGLLKEPSRGAIILLAPPLIGVSSNSFSKIKNNGTMIGWLQVLGYDQYIGQSFKDYIGFSVFHASPLNSTAGLWEGAFIGLEAHYKNIFNIGYGVSYKEQTVGLENGRISKIFISVALFNKFFKK